ncbi:thiol:disulfide interchange protein DsbD [Candidatus Rickettsiella viridis]|uniref:Thiol:disulfide interchange protein DsbD n=1 Tax=Candidatus Rickettsiella viridis TaxID=676208 RepID=A0A2Z5V704_9COXI|nr:protein-disulfide reductase DsbD [Candidatus Rickettsiella viridis]BBB14987.1 thiol:disulfide interchange protein DsbD [Candidatus Rickettsiella viridis]
MLFFSKFIKIFVLGSLLGGVFTTSYADEPLPVEQVFQVTTKQLDAQTMSVHWAIKPGYYLYREKMHFESDQPIKSVVLPPGIPKHNKFLNNYQVYQSGTTVLLKFIHPLKNTLKLSIHYQGCAAAGFCYPPVTRQLTLSLQKGVGTSQSTAKGEQGKAMRLLASHNIGLILLGFFGFGLLLSLTPCVLPLIPVLSAIILGQKQQLTTLKAFSLSLTYVLAMALTYALAGVFAGLAGSYLQSFLQSPWVIIFVSLVFVFLAFSLFGFYDLQLPASWQEKLNNLTNRQQGGNYWGVALMGCLSTLVISPCITAPLVGVLTYIGNTGNAVLGGFALFILGLGSGVPLLIIGTSAGKWLPKSGPWMNGVKIVLGIMMLVMAGWLLLRIVPQNLQPFNGFKSQQAAVNGNFQAIKGIPDLNRALIKAKQENKPVLLDFYANWCISCKEMEHAVFPESQVKSLLSRFIVLRADVTANDAIDKALEKKFNVIAPPTFLFFTPDGRELNEQRIVGQLGHQAFAKHLQQVLSSK